MKKSGYLFLFLFIFVSRAGGQNVVATETHYRGTIGKKLQVYVRLQQKGDSLSGTYMYLSQGKIIPVKGIVRSGWMNFAEYGDPAKRAATGYFECKLAGDSLVGTWFSGDRMKQLATALVRSGPTIEHRTITTSIQSADDEPRTVVLDAVVPHIKSSVAGKLNDSLQKHALEFSYSGKMASWDPDSKDSMDWYDESSYMVEYMDDALLSISVSKSSYMGGAHPNHGVIGLTYNLANGKLLTVADCFKESMLPKLGTLSVMEVQKCLAEGDSEDPFEMDEYIAECVTPNATLSSLTVTPRSITFEFTECMPHAMMACGYSEISFSQLKGFVIPNGPLGKFVK